jgi:hypothetical protein
MLSSVYTQWLKNNDTAQNAMVIWCDLTKSGHLTAPELNASLDQLRITICASVCGGWGGRTGGMAL